MRAAPPQSPAQPAPTCLVLAKSLLPGPGRCPATGGTCAKGELRAKTAAQQRVRPSDVSQARALQRLAAERAGVATITPAAAAPQRLDRTA